MTAVRRTELRSIGAPEQYQALAKAGAAARWAARAAGVVMLCALPVTAQPETVSEQPPFNTLETAENLETGGFRDQQSTALARALVTVTQNLQTKADYDAGMQGIRFEIASGFSGLHALISESEARTADRFNSLLMWVIGIVVSGGSGLAAIVISVLPYRIRGWKPDNFENPLTEHDAERGRSAPQERL